MPFTDFECAIAKSQIGRFVAGEKLSDETVRQLEAHISECEGCKAFIAQRRQELVSLVGPEGSDLAGQAPAVRVDQITQRPARKIPPISTSAVVEVEIPEETVIDAQREFASIVAEKLKQPLGEASEAAKQAGRISQNEINNALKLFGTKNPTELPAKPKSLLKNSEGAASTPAPASSGQAAAMAKPKGGGFGSLFSKKPKATEEAVVIELPLENNQPADGQPQLTVVEGDTPAKKKMSMGNLFKKGAPKAAAQTLTAEAQPAKEKLSIGKLFKGGAPKIAQEAVAAVAKPAEPKLKPLSDAPIGKANLGRPVLFGLALAAVVGVMGTVAKNPTAMLGGKAAVVEAGPKMKQGAKAAAESDLPVAPLPKQASKTPTLKTPPKFNPRAEAWRRIRAGKSIKDLNLPGVTTPAKKAALARLAVPTKPGAKKPAAGKPIAKAGKPALVKKAPVAKKPLIAKAIKPKTAKPVLGIKPLKAKPAKKALVKAKKKVAPKAIKKVAKARKPSNSVRVYDEAGRPIN